MRSLRLMDAVEPPVRAGGVVLKCEHGDVGVGTMVQAAQATPGAAKAYLGQVLPVSRSMGRRPHTVTDLLTMPRIIITSLATLFAWFYRSEFR